MKEEIDRKRESKANNKSGGAAERGNHGADEVCAKVR